MSETKLTDDEMADLINDARLAQSLKRSLAEIKALCQRYGVDEGLPWRQWLEELDRRLDCECNEDGDDDDE